MTPDLGTLSVSVSGSGQGIIVPTNDSYMSKTETAGTEIKRLVFPRAKARAKVTGFRYRPGATAHNLYFMPAVGPAGGREIKVTEKAESGQAVLKVDRLLTDPAGGATAAGDWFSVLHEDGSWVPYKLDSVSGLSLTFTTNLTEDALAGARVFYHAAPADHTDRTYLTVASADNAEGGDGDRVTLAVATGDDEPLLVLADNATNAGNLKILSFGYAFDN